LLNKLDATLAMAKRPTDLDLAWIWVERNDSQNYVVLGGPAIRLRVEDLR
jgi:hypothetical protein